MTKRWLLVCSCLLMLTGMRDPFKPPDADAGSLNCRCGVTRAW